MKEVERLRITQALGVLDFLSSLFMEENKESLKDSEVAREEEDMELMNAINALS